jgi:ABC-2 type transport system ATP-binding protein
MWIPLGFNNHREIRMLLEIHDLTKRYRGGVLANDGVSLGAAEGEVLGLLGHNGAGKTTLVHQVVGLLRPTAGSIRIAGTDAVADPALARRLTAIQPQAQVPITGLTPRQAIELIGRMRGGSSAQVRARADRLIDALDIGEWRDVDAGRLSGGVKRLTSFCMAAIRPGRLVILDEPTNDVDPVRRRLLWAQVRALADEGVAVVLVTHNVVEAERSVDRLVLLDAGRVVAAGSPAQLKAGIADGLRLELVPEPDRAPAIPSWLGAAVARNGRPTIVVSRELAGAAVAWAAECQRAGDIEEFSLVPANLEDAYIAHVGRRPVDHADHADASESLEVIDVPAA